MTAASARATSLGVPTFHHRDFPVAQLLAAKADQGLTVSVVLPARNEEATIGPIVAAIGAGLAEHGVVDELIVVDSDSTDRTAATAEAAGARVVDASEVFAELGAAQGKGDAMWRGLASSKGDIVVWVDGDIVDFDVRFVTGVLGPLLADPSTVLSKGFYERPLVGADGVHETGGGRVTELVARPLLALVAPELSEIVQPLSGEYAMRRDVAEALPFAMGYGVEAGLLLDVAARHGLNSLAQVDLHEHVHRNRPLDQLSATAYEVARAILSRRAKVVLSDDYERATVAGLEPVATVTGERPPLRAYRPR